MWISTYSCYMVQQHCVRDEIVDTDWKLKYLFPSMLAAEFDSHIKVICTKLYVDCLN